jgi:hypothetical protein
MYSDMSSSHVVVVSSGFFVIGKAMLTKVCVKCGVEKDVGDYHKRKDRKEGVYSWCKVCFKQYHAQRYESNKEVELEKRKSWYVSNREVALERVRAYTKANPHVRNTHKAKRRAAEYNATPSWANKEHIKSLYLIASINKQGGYDLHVDHIVPLQSALVCGLHCEANLQLLPASDNISKSNRWWPDQW